MIKVKRKYPKHRKPANRTKSSYLPKTAAAKAKVQANLQRGPSAERTPRFIKRDGTISYENLQRMDIIEFAEIALGMDFVERPSQRVILKALYGLPLTAAELPLYTELTTNETVFEDGIEKTEGLWAIGRRGGKSYLSSLIALFEATRNKWKQYLAPGEVGYAAITATKQQQAVDIIGASCARLMENSRFAHLVVESWSTSLVLSNGMRIVSAPCSSSALRGIPCFLLIFDELAHFRIEGPKSDETVINALKPGQAQFPGAKCLKISTPAAKMGIFWDEFDEGFQVPGRLTIQAPTRTVNPVIPQETIDKEMLRDPDNANREFFSEFAEQVDSFLPFNKLKEAFVLAGDLLPESSKRYFIGTDQSGLSLKGDRFAMSVAHREGKEVIVDVVRSWSTTKGREIIAEITVIAKDYSVGEVVIDRYAAGWLREAFEAAGLQVKIRPTLPEVYSNFKSLLLAGCLRLPDRKPLRDGLARTQSFYGRNNSMSIFHERTAGNHADESDAVVTAVFEASSKQQGGYMSETLKKMDEREQLRKAV